MSEVLFLDVNVPMYAAGGAHRCKQSCSWVMREVSEGRLLVALDTEIIQEILYRFGALQKWDIAVRMANDTLTLVPNVYPIYPDDIRLAVQLFERYAHRGVQARDIIHVAVMQNNGLTHIISTDEHFDLVPEITRLDPQIMFEKRGMPGLGQT